MWAKNYLTVLIGNFDFNFDTDVLEAQLSAIEFEMNQELEGEVVSHQEAEAVYA